MTNAERERLILEACEKTTNMGWRVLPVGWLFPNTRECCPMGALSVALLPSDELEAAVMRPADNAAQLLETDRFWCWSFAAGFDGQDYGRDSDAKALGRKLRRKLLGGEPK